jgi:hypothetical protein
MKRFWPLILIATGLILLLGGFAYDLNLAGIPYQDPTPEMSERFNRHKNIASVIYLCGVGALLVGVLASLIRWIIRRFSSPVAA